MSLDHREVWLWGGPLDQKRFDSLGIWSCFSGFTKRCVAQMTLTTCDEELRRIAEPHVYITARREFCFGRRRPSPGSAPWRRGDCGCFRQ